MTQDSQMPHGQHHENQQGSGRHPDLVRLYDLTVRGAHYINLCQPFFNLFVRLYVARVFFTTAILQIADWRITVSLFRWEYQIPDIVSPMHTALLAVAIEIIFSISLALGFFGRGSAVILFIFNGFAVSANPDMTYVAFSGHVLWAWLLGLLIFNGTGAFSLDHVIGRWFDHKYVHPM